MTEKALLELCRVWQTRLGLDHWLIECRVAAFEDPPYAYAHADRHIMYNRALIEFQPWLLASDRAPNPDNFLQTAITDQRREEALVHELLHCWTRDYRQIVEDHLDARLAPDTARLIQDVVTATEERLVDGLATALVAAFGASQ